MFSGPFHLFFYIFFITSQGLGTCSQALFHDFYFYYFYFFYFTGPEPRLVSSPCFIFFIILFTHRARDTFLGLFSSPDFVLFFSHPFTMPYVRRFNIKTMNQIANI